ncbi:MAG: MFS transporter [Pseudonocardia sp.]
MADTEPVRTGSGWQRIRAAWAVTAVFALSNSPTPLYVYWQDRMGFSAATLTLVFSAYIAGLVLTLLVAGRAGDRFGRRRVVLPGIAIAVVSAVLFVIADSVAVLVVARLLVGIAVGIVVTAGMAAVVDLSDPGGHDAAAVLASIAMVFGAGLGPLIGGIVFQLTDEPVVPVFALNIVLLLVALAGYPGLRLPGPAAGSTGFPWPRLPHVAPRHRSRLRGGVSMFAPGLTATSFVLSLGPSLLVLALGATSPILAGGLACLMFLAATGSQLALSRLAVPRLFALGSASIVLAMVAVVLTLRTQSVIPFAVAVVLAGGAQGLGQLGGLRLIARHVADHERAEANAALNIGAYVPAAVLTVATGYAVGVWGMHAAATVLAALLAGLGVVLGVPAVRRSGADERPDPT